MAKYSSIYKSFDEFYDTILRGNEVEFKYMETAYFLLPHFENNKVVGVSFGRFGTENEIICLSKQELYNVKINDQLLGDILYLTDILWYNFD